MSVLLIRLARVQGSIFACQSMAAAVIGITSAVWSPGMRGTSYSSGHSGSCVRRSFNAFKFPCGSVRWVWWMKCRSVDLKKHPSKFMTGYSALRFVSAQHLSISRFLNSAYQELPQRCPVPYQNYLHQDRKSLSPVTFSQLQTKKYDVFKFIRTT